MELIRELFIDFLKGGALEILISNNPDFEHLAEKECIKTLDKIRQIIRDDSLDDEECFERIEKIVCLLESKGMDCGARHDF